MSCSAAVNSVVCQEVFDDNSQPSEEEIREYAIRIGIDPENEPHLLPIAKDGVMKALPPNWVPVLDKELNLYYYYNSVTNQASWEHPLDGEIRDFVRKCKLESSSSTADDDSKTSLREELKSYEEVATVGTEDMQSWNTGNIPALAGIPGATGNRRPASAVPQQSGLLSRRTLTLEKSSNEESKGRPSTSFIGRFAIDRVPKIDVNRPLQRLEPEEDGIVGQERIQRPPGRSKLTLTGGGSVFLKSNQQKSAGVSSPTKSIETKTVEMPAGTPGRSPNIDEPRSILRAPSADRPLWDRNPQELTSSERSLWRQQELEDDRKFVRFSLEKGLDMNFKLSEDEDDDDFEDDDEEDDDDILKVLAKGPRWRPESGSSGKVSAERKGTKEVTERKNHFGNDTFGGRNDRSETQKLIDGLLGVPLSVELKALEEPDAWHGTNSSKVDDLKTSPSHIESILERSQRALRADSLASIKRPSPTDERIGKKLESLWDRRKEKSKEEDSEDESKKAEAKTMSGVLEASDRREERAGKTDKRTTTVIDLRLENNEPSSPPDQLQDSDGKGDSSSSSSSDQKNESTEKESKEESRQEEKTTDEQGDGEKKGQVAGRSGSPAEKKTEKGKGDSTQREKALREWNVMPDQPYRPPLSRQSSQQQLIRKTEAESTSEREKAYRDWNVTGIVQELDEALQVLQDKTAKEGKTDKEEKTVVKEKERKSDSLSISSDLTERLKEYARLEKEHSERLAREEEEHRKRLEEIEKEHKEKLKMFEEEHKAAIEKADAEDREKQQQRQKSWKETMDQEEQERRVRLQLNKEEQRRVISDLQHEHHKAMAALETENQADILRLREKHASNLQSLREQFNKEEEALRKEQAERLESIREERAAHRLSDTQDNARALERLRCEKHLLEDKYQILKEKYFNLKKELNSAMLRREQRREQRKSETDASTSLSNTHTDKAQDKSSNGAKRHHQRGQQQQQQQRQSQQQGQQQQDQGQQQQQQQEQQQQEQQQKGQENQQQEKGKQQQSQNQEQPTDDSSFSTLDSDNNNTQTKKGRSGNVAAQVMWWNSSISDEDKRKDKKSNPEPEDTTPMGILRKQFRTLDELEEQFPATAVADTYLPYPFSENDRELGSAELEFFRHRIHLEQDLVRQARNLLRAQHNVYITRLHNLKLKRSACDQKVDSSVSINTLNQMAHEEKELSQMEASLQRTRSLLCEKIMRLRRLENSLRNVSDTTKPSEKPTRWPSKSGDADRKYAWEREATFDYANHDNSSDSGESSVPNIPTGKFFGKDDHFRRGNPLLFADDSNDINASLNTLNAEINEIWSVLCRKRAAAGLGPPPVLSSSRPPTSNAWLPPNTNASTNPTFQNDGGLVERARNLRRWLQRAKMSATITQSDTTIKHQISL